MKIDLNNLTAKNNKISFKKKNFRKTRIKKYKNKNHNKNKIKQIIFMYNNLLQ